MLVKHLIRELQKCNPDAEVLTEGCDCVGESFSLSRQGPDEVLVCRGAGGATYDNKADTPEPLSI